MDSNHKVVITCLAFTYGIYFQKFPLLCMDVLLTRYDWIQDLRIRPTLYILLYFLLKASHVHITQSKENIRGSGVLKVSFFTSYVG